MLTNKFNYRLLAILGHNIYPNMIYREKMLCYLKNCWIPFQLFFSMILPGIFYINQNSNEIGKSLFMASQISAFISCIYAYLNLCYHKYNVNEIFNEIESIVIKRMKMIESDLYEKMIWYTENFIKIPMFIFLGSYTINVFGMFTLSVVISIFKDDHNTKNLYLPYVNM